MEAFWYLLFRYYEFNELIDFDCKHSLLQLFQYYISPAYNVHFAHRDKKLVWKLFGICCFGNMSLMNS